jgi:serine/threonine-protein kinase
VLVGTFVDGKYRIEEPIALGGMAAVYQATQVHLGRTVAMKVLLPRHQSESKRFYQEAKLAMSIFHPNVVRTFDRGILPDGMPYMVMELLEGCTLGDYLDAHGSLSVAQTLALGEQILGALSATHALGIVHRDLKPDNVFLEGGLAGAGAPEAKLLDFGISRALRASARMTLSGITLGTPEYLSPEQARGERDVDHRTDLWSVGVLLYECLTGLLPFVGADLQKLLFAILGQTPAPPSHHAPGIPRSLDAIILSALAKKPSERFPTADDMREALQEAAPTHRFPVITTKSC